MSKAYIGTKIVRAWPSQREGEDGYTVRYEDGYLSWSPKDVFERSYREVTTKEKLMTLSDGLDTKSPQAPEEAS